jgi:HAD superfamily hydrolase (TIGR01509 family)
MKAVIFDMDGVLVDSEPLHYESDITLLERLGISAPEGCLDRFVGMTNPVMWAEIAREFAIEQDVDEILNAQLSLKLKLLKKADLKPIDGIPELLAEIRKARLPVAVASSSSAIFIKEVLSRIGVSRYIDAYVSGENVKRSKPEPDVFLKAAETIGVDPALCVAIEDSKNGAIAAKRAGMKCVGYRNPHPGNQDLSVCDLVVDDLKALSLKALRALF